MAQKRKMIIDTIYAGEEKDEIETNEKECENNNHKTQSQNKLKDKTTIEINGSNYEINF